MKNKKGNFRDIPEYLNFAIVFGILILIAGTILFKINDNVSSNATIPTEAKNGSSNLFSSFTKFHDIAFPFLYLVFFAFSVVMARLIPSNPKFIIIGIVYMIALTFGAMFIENIWDSFYSSGAFTDILANLTFIPFMLNHLIYFTLLYCGGVAIALYTKDV